MRKQGWRASFAFRCLLGASLLALSVSFLGIAVLPELIRTKFKHVSFGTVAADPAGESSLLAAAPLPRPVPAAKAPRFDGCYGKLPLSFEANLGQADAAVRFISRGPGYRLFLTGNEAVIALTKPLKAQGESWQGARVEGLAPPRPLLSAGPFSGLHELQFPQGQRVSSAGQGRPVNLQPQAAAPAVLRMRLAGANPHAKVTGADEVPAKSNYFIGNDPRKWRTNIPNYARVRYQDIYPGVDLIYYGNQRQLEYDFTVAPGAEPNQIALAIESSEGARELEPARVDNAGDLVIRDHDGEIRFHKPTAYQPGSPGTRQLLGCRYVLLANGEVGFQVAGRDPAQALVIDPVLTYATYLGGSTGPDAAYGMAVDGNGNAYLAGATFSIDFPTTASTFQTSLHGAAQTNAFISKLSADGSTLLYSTYLGGGGQNQLNYATGIAVDNSGSAFVTGNTQSIDFPTVNPFQGPVNGGGAGVFVTKLNATGSALVFSTYLGGLINAYAGGIAVSSGGNAYVTGYTSSPDFPTTAASFQPVVPPPTVSEYDAFVTEFSASGSALVYSTYLAGSGGSTGNSIAVDSAGSAYVTGDTFSSDFPQSGSLRLPCTNNILNTSAFVSKLSPDGSALSYSTCLGPAFSGGAIAVDATGAAYVTGSTSTSFPTTSGAFQTTPNGFMNAFVTKLNAAGSALVYSTYLSGGSASSAGTFRIQSGMAIAVDANGDAYVAGYTDVSNFPLANPLRANFGGGDCENYTSAFPNLTACGDAFVSELNPAGSALNFSTYFGGSGNDGAAGIALDSAGNIYIAGETGSTDLPTINPLQPSFAGGGSDAFVAKIGPANSSAVSLSPASLVFADQSVNTSSAVQPVALRNMGSALLNIASIQTGGDFSQTNTCGSAVVGGADCTISVTFKPLGTGMRSGALAVTDNASGSPHTTALAGTGVDPSAAAVLSPTSLTFSSQVLGGNASEMKTATLASNGTASLTIFSIAASGDFAQSNNCGGSLAAGANCTITVTFHATAAGLRNGTITIADDAPGTPHTVGLTGEGVDFSLAAAPTAVSVTAGQTATYMLSITPVGGFNQPVALACSGAPPLSTCSVSPASMTPDGTNPENATVTVTTTARSMVPPGKNPFTLPPASNPCRALPWLLTLTVLTAILGTFGFAVGGARQVGRMRRLKVRLAFPVIVAICLLVSCGGGSSSSGGHPGTPAGTYTLTLTGIVSTTAGPVSRSASVSLTVN
jgi:Beta-propeller repeat